VSDTEAVTWVMSALEKPRVVSALPQTERRIALMALRRLLDRIEREERERPRAT
jgi:hypothetical protein